MELLIRGLFFLGGVVVAAAGFLFYAWYLSMKERVRLAEEARNMMEEALKAVEAQQQAAAEQLQKTVEEIVKRRSTPKAVTAPQMPTDPAVSTTVKERIKKAVELTNKQSQIDPKKGPEFQEQHNELEMEKLAVLKSILADGFDPPITIRLDGSVKEMLLSAYIKDLSKGLA